MARKLDSIINAIASALVSMPGSTGAELSAYLENPRAYRRLSEIQRLGLAERRGQRKCHISGKLAWIWFPSDKPAEPDRGELTPQQEIKRLKARVEYLVNENERLKQIQEHDRRIIDKLSPKTT